MFSGRQNRCSLRRRGAATVELAICLPAMVLVTLGAIESTNAIYLKQSLTSIAYEGVRVASGTGGTTADAEAICQQLLASRNIQNATVSCTRILSSTPPGTPITVSVSASVENNSLGITRYFRDNMLTGSATMPRL